MPGVLIDDLPFSLDSVSSASSPYFESLCGQQASSPSGFYSQAQLGPLLSPLSSSISEATAKSAFQQQQHQLKFVNMSLDRPPQAEHCQYLDEQHQQHLDAATALWMNASSSSNRFFNGNSNSTSNNSSSSSINGDVVKDLLMEAMAASSGSSSCESPRASPTAHEALAAALHKFLPSNNSEEAAWSAEDLYSCDEFRMFEFKVRRCMRGRSHDWTECPFAHPGEKARRRDPRRFHYSGTACPDFRKGNCKNGDACELAHGVFECWLHPARYRTQPCKDGRNCKRRVCFFAHTPEQLRLLPAAAQAAAAVSSSSSGSSCSSPKSSSSLRSGGGSGSPLFRSFSDNNNSISGGDRIGEGSSGCCCHHHHQYVGSPRHHQLLGCGGSSCSGHSCCRMLSSPTSTLVGLAHSPPPLSPPLSPSVSPPLSPSSASLSMSMAASAVARGALFSSQQQQQQQQSSSPSSAQRRHLERLASLEHQHQQQQQQQQRRPLMHSYPSAPSSPGGSSHHHHSPFSSSSSSNNHGGSPMSDLVSALQQLELKGGSGGGPMWMQQLAIANQSSSSSNQQQQQYTMGPSPLRPSNTTTMGGNVRGCSSMSLPGTPTKPRWDCGGMWEMDVGEDEEDEMAALASPRVESGRDLRAKIYGRLVGKKEAAAAAAAAARLEPAIGDGFEMEAAVAGEPSPDLNWVNELVTE